MKSTSKSYASLVACLVVAAVAASAQASVQQETTRAGLAGTDNIDWGDLGPSGTLVVNPFVITSDDGVNVTVGKTQATTFQRINQGSWAGNFGNNQALLWTGDFNVFPNVMRLSFGGPGITGGGAQFQSDVYGSFTTRIEAFDSALASLGFFDVVGTSNANGDGSAVFVGISDTTTPIYAIEFSLRSVTDNFFGSFAINQFDFSPAGATPGAVPEAASLAVWSLLGGTAAIVCLKSRAKRRKNPANSGAK